MDLDRELTDSAGASSSVSVPTRGAGRPLWEAALAWCDATLVSNLFAALDAMQRVTAPTKITGNALSPKIAGRDGGAILVMIALFSRMDAWEAATKAQAKAAKAVDADFRHRIANGELLVWGVREQPKLERHFTHISRVWAHGLKIDWEGNSASFGAQTFVALTCEKATNAAPDDPRREKAPSKRGRKGFPIDRFVEIARSRSRSSNAKREADLLLAEYRKKYSEKPPAHSMIQRNMEEIYNKASRYK